MNYNWKYDLFIRWMSAATLLISVFLRRFNIEAATFFFGDQGQMLLIGQNIFKNHVFPLVGPAVTVKHVLQPPLNYYLVGFLSWLNSDPLVVIWAYFFMNIVAMMLLYHVVIQLADKVTGLIFLCLFGFSCGMIIHAQSMWEPHPVVFFVSLALWCFHRGWEKRTFWWMVAGCISFGFALGSYISAILLIPYVIVHLYRWIRRHWHVSPSRGAFYTVVIFGYCSLWSYIPQIATEAQQKVTTLEALFFPSSFSFLTLWDFPYRAYLAMNVIAKEWLAYRVLPVWGWVLGGWIVFLGWHMWKIKTNTLISIRIQKLIIFCSMPAVFVGFLGSLLYDGVMFGYRYNALVPVAMLYIAAAVRYCIVQQRFWARAISIGGLLVYVYCNIFYWYTLTVKEPTHDMPVARDVVSYVLQREHDVYRAGSYAVHVFTARDMFDWDASPLWYLLTTSGYEYEILPPGNLLNRDFWNENVQTAYVVCRLEAQIVTEDACEKQYTYFNPNYVVSERVILPHKTILLLFKQKNNVFP